MLILVEVNIRGMHHIHQANYMPFLVQFLVAQFLGFLLRGRVLGGSSAINGGFYSRATEEFVCKDAWDKVKTSIDTLVTSIDTLECIFFLAFGMINLKGQKNSRKSTENNWEVQEATTLDMGGVKTFLPRPFLVNLNT